MANPNRPDYRTLSDELAEMERTDPVLRKIVAEADRIYRIGWLWFEFEAWRP